MKICKCGNEIKRGTKCSGCYTKEWRKNNPGKYKAIEKRYYLKHREKRIANAEKWNKEHPVEHNRMCRIAHDKWIEKNRGRWNKYQRDYKRKKKGKS